MMTVPKTANPRFFQHRVQGQVCLIVNRERPRTFAPAVSQRILVSMKALHCRVLVFDGASRICPDADLAETVDDQADRQDAGKVDSQGI